MARPSAVPGKANKGKKQKPVWGSLKPGRTSKTTHYESSPASQSAKKKKRDSQETKTSIGDNTPKKNNKSKSSSETSGEGKRGDKAGGALGTEGGSQGGGEGAGEGTPRQNPRKWHKSGRKKHGAERPKPRYPEKAEQSSGKNLGKRRRAFEKRQRLKAQKQGGKHQSEGTTGGGALWMDADETTKVEAQDKPLDEKKSKDKTKKSAKKAKDAVNIAGDTTPSKKLLAVQKTIEKPTGKGGGILDKLKAKLSGGHFRFLNESLYTTTGKEAFTTFSEQPELFDQYHAGFREQTAKWPVQPIHVCRDWLKSKPKSWTVADFGCGDAQLAKIVRQKVTSLDLVARSEEVIACNMAHTPLETSTKNAVVFVLALMGTDYGSFIVEAHRVLVARGSLWIAEVRSRLEHGPEESDNFMGAFISAVKEVGFNLVTKNATNKMFVVFEFQKVDKVGKPHNQISWPDLKACTYKKR